MKKKDKKDILMWIVWAHLWVADITALFWTTNKWCITDIDHGHYPFYNVLMPGFSILWFFILLCLLIPMINRTTNNK